MRREVKRQLFRTRVHTATCWRQADSHPCYTIKTPFSSSSAVVERWCGSSGSGQLLAFRQVAVAELRGQESLHEIPGHFRADCASAHAEDIHVLSSTPCLEEK